LWPPLHGGIAASEQDEPEKFNGDSGNNKGRALRHGDEHDKGS